MKARKKAEWDNKRYKYSDDVLKKTMKDVNYAFEKSKSGYKRNASGKISNVKKIGYRNISFESDDFIKTSRLLYNDEINNIVTAALADVAAHYYDMAVEESLKMYPQKKRKEKKFTPAKIRKWNALYVQGLRTSFMQELEMQSYYMSYRLSNALNEGVKKNAGKDETKDKMKSGILDFGSVAVLLAYKLQKKKLSNAIDNAFTHIVELATLEGYKDMDVEYVMRVAELDERTCKECEMLDGEIYLAEEAPEVMIHDFCRCYYVPWDPLMDE